MLLHESKELLKGHVCTPYDAASAASSIHSQPWDAGAALWAEPRPVGARRNSYGGPVSAKEAGRAFDPFARGRRLLTRR